MSGSFEDLGLSEPTLQALRDVGYEAPSPIQEQAIPELLVAFTVLREDVDATLADPRVLAVLDRFKTDPTIAPLVSRNMEQIGRLIIFDDVTDRAELERRLVQADKLSSIGLLAAGVAHEVNTPLAVISSYAQMLSKQVQGDPQKSGLLEKITRQTFRASEIVNNLLNFSRTSGTEFTDVDINKVISDTLALLEHQFKTAKVHVASELTQ